MSMIAYEQIKGSSLGQTIIWRGLGDGDWGKPLPLKDRNDKSYQIFGESTGVEIFSIWGTLNPDDLVRSPTDIDSTWVLLVNHNGQAMQTTSLPYMASGVINTSYVTVSVSGEGAVGNFILQATK